MLEPRIFPRLGQLLRSVITHTGYRPCIQFQGLDKNLDDVANETRSGVNFELLGELKAAWVSALSSDCGPSWGQLADSAWDRFQGAFHFLVKELDTSALRRDAAHERVYQWVFIPELSGLLRRASNELPGLDVDVWWQSPFAAWVAHVAALTQQTESSIRDHVELHLKVDARSIARWTAGEVIGKSLWPYRDTTLAAVGHVKTSRLSDRDLERVTGWLMLAVTVQSIDARDREAIRRDFARHNRNRLKSLNEAIERLKRETFDTPGFPVRQNVIPILDGLHELFANFKSNQDKLGKLLEQFARLLDQLPPETKVRYQFYFDLYSARYQANIEETDRAIELYERAVDGVWWYAGPRQYGILQEALKYAVGIGDKVRAEHFWDKCYLLGLNKPPKKVLDKQELRRISLAFEHMFRPLKAKLRVPPKMEFVMADKPFSLSAKELKKPNQKQAFAEGRTRRTPLMRAVSEGELSDVIKALEAGGDPNDYITESGEGPFIYALRRACERKDPAILEHFLSLSLSKDTLNRAASTKKETPLKIALEMGDAGIVRKLLALGADMEQPCGSGESALCYALFLYRGSLDDHALDKQAYLAGLVPGDGDDAKAGAVLDVELAARRQALSASMLEPWQKNLFEAARAYISRRPDERKDVIMALLESGADANRRYTIDTHPRDRWTPTLYAAEIGDLALFKALLAAGGDPDHSLEDGSPLDRQDAMWVAVRNDHHAIAKYLKEMSLSR